MDRNILVCNIETGEAENVDRVENARLLVLQWLENVSAVKENIHISGVDRDEFFKEIMVEGNYVQYLDKKETSDGGFEIGTVNGKLFKIAGSDGFIDLVKEENLTEEEKDLVMRLAIQRWYW